MTFRLFKKAKTVHESRNRQRLAILAVILLLMLAMAWAHWHRGESLCELEPACGPSTPQ